jgi:hypothetical protein
METTAVRRGRFPREVFEDSPYRKTIVVALVAGSDTVRLQLPPLQLTDGCVETATTPALLLTRSYSVAVVREGAEAILMVTLKALLFLLTATSSTCAELPEWAKAYTEVFPTSDVCAYAAVSPTVAPLPS